MTKIPPPRARRGVRPVLPALAAVLLTLTGTAAAPGTAVPGAAGPGRPSAGWLRPARPRPARPFPARP